MLTLQASQDRPLVARYVAELSGDAEAQGLGREELRARVVRGLDHARRLDAAAGFEQAGLVALTVFFRPDWMTLPEVQELFATPMKLEAKIRITMHEAFYGEQG